MMLPQSTKSARTKNPWPQLSLLDMDGQNPAPPKKPKKPLNGDSPAYANTTCFGSWFQSGAKWISSIHGMFSFFPGSSCKGFGCEATGGWGDLRLLSARAQA